MSPQTCINNGAGLERVRFFARQLITADDMLAEQQYFRQKLRRHNRFLHGCGVVCGLRVMAAPDDKKTMPWRVKIEAGYALGPYGDEIYVAEAYCFDLATCLDLVPDPCEPGEPPKPIPPKSGELYVAIRYLECDSRPVRVHPLGCACEETLCEYSRIRDDFEIACLPEPPKFTSPPLLCELRKEKDLAECPPCPESPWVVLAKVVLPKPTKTEPDASKIELAVGAIDNFVRRQVFSTVMLQEQLIQCCCKQETTGVVVLPLHEPVDLFIDKTASTVENSITYTIRVSNQGEEAAQNVVVTDRPPQGDIDEKSFEIQPNTAGDWTNTDPEKGLLTATLGTLQPGPGNEVTLKFTINVEQGEHKNTAKISADNATSKELTIVTTV